MIKLYRKLDRKSPFTYAATWWSSTLESSEYHHTTSAVVCTAAIAYLYTELRSILYLHIIYICETHLLNIITWFNSQPH